MNNKEIIALIKENEGLKLKYFKYKRKFKALNRILRGGLYSKIDGLGYTRVQLMHRINAETDADERRRLQGALNFATKERQELQAIYDMCVEAIKD